MLKYIHIILLVCLFNLPLSRLLLAQQLIRQTLSSTGGAKVVAPFRTSFTFGSCPGCSTLHPSSPSTAGYVRQGFQQPPVSPQSQACASANLKAIFTIAQEPLINASCGLKFDMEYGGSSIQGVTFLWDFGEGAIPKTSALPNPTGVVYATSGSKTVSLTLSKDACTLSTAHIVSVLPSQTGFIATATSTQAKCFGEQSGKISLTTTGGTGNISYLWNNGVVTKDLANVAAGNYAFTVTDVNGCKYNGSAIVGQPDTSLYYKATVIRTTCISSKSGSATLYPGGGTAPYNILWAGGSKSAHLDSLRSDSTYHFTISDAKGCKIDSSINIPACNITQINHAYDIITPNGDGLNENFSVINIQDYPSNELFIFNRWGQMVYSKKGYNNEWHGQTNSGADLPSAAYFYTINLHDSQNQVWIGSITLIR